MIMVLKGFVQAAWFWGALSLSVALATAQSPQPERKSGFEFISPESQATQRDDFSNPGMLWVAEGEALWNAKAGGAGKSCAGCGEHEGRRRSLPRLFCRERTANRSSEPHQRLQKDQPERDTFSARKPGTPCALGFPWKAVARHADYDG